MWQHEITKTIPLLSEKGELTQAGWARQPYPVYERKAIKASPLRICELIVVRLYKTFSLPYTAANCSSLVTPFINDRITVCSPT